MINDFFSDYSFWAWLILGLILVGLETITPGIFLLWIGIAAIVTGILDSLFHFSWPISLLVFAVSSIITVFLARYLDDIQKEKNIAFKSLNQGASQFIGQTFYLSEGIVNGAGRIQIKDSSWPVESSEALIKGAHVRVTAVADNGITLLVSSVS